MFPFFALPIEIQDSPVRSDRLHRLQPVLHKQALEWPPDHQRVPGHYQIGRGPVAASGDLWLRRRLLHRQ